MMIMMIITFAILSLTSVNVVISSPVSDNIKASCAGDFNATDGGDSSYCDQLCNIKHGCLNTRVANNAGCKCKDGFFYNFVIGKCVRDEDCRDKCGENEEWSDCELARCTPKTCNDIGFPIACASVAHPCAGGCVCKNGYVRKDNKCVPATECDSCRGDFNATAGDGRYCGSRCSDKNSCVTSWEDFNGCKCKDGFAYNDIIGKCVKEEDCPTPCNGDPFAETKECASDDICHPTCENPNPKICTRSCIINGCECASGYVQEKARGKCVKIDECPDNLGCDGDPNAVITSCPSPCPLACTDEGPVACPAVCLPLGCACKSGYVLSEPGGKCIETEKCPKKPYWLSGFSE